MTEMHLDLCIQSTAHLLETVSNIKENIRILEVFLKSGLQNVDFDTSGFSFPSGDYSIGKGKEYSNFYPHFNHKNFLNGSRHTNCCCMCHFRIQQAKHENVLSRPTSRASATTVSNLSNGNAKSKVQITPRLNKTASLRRAKVLQRIASVKN